MIISRSNATADLIDQKARFRLFVEGRKGHSIDASALKCLLPMIDIDSIGPSFYLKSVATALHPVHPDYFFLIDRDHQDDQTVAKSWDQFPDTSTANLIIWRKRELENYFLDPDYLVKSAYCTKSIDELWHVILQLANQRVFLDVVNQVILSIREGQKSTWIKLFKNPNDFPDQDTALELLRNTRMFPGSVIPLADTSLHASKRAFLTARPSGMVGFQCSR